jgi:hypothetical protein
MNGHGFERHLEGLLEGARRLGRPDLPTRTHTHTHTHATYTPHTTHHHHHHTPHATTAAGYSRVPQGPHGTMDTACGPGHPRIMGCSSSVRNCSDVLVRTGRSPPALFETMAMQLPTRLTTQQTPVQRGTPCPWGPCPWAPCPSARCAKLCSLGSEWQQHRPSPRAAPRQLRPCMGDFWVGIVALRCWWQGLAAGTRRRMARGSPSRTLSRTRWSCSTSSRSPRDRASPLRSSETCSRAAWPLGSLALTPPP